MFTKKRFKYIALSFLLLVCVFPVSAQDVILNYTFDSDLQGLEEWIINGGSPVHMDGHAWSPEFGGSYSLNGSGGGKGTLIGNQSHNLTVGQTLSWNVYVTDFTAGGNVLSTGIGFCNASLAAGSDVAVGPQNAQVAPSTGWCDQRGGLIEIWNYIGGDMLVADDHNYSLAITRDNETGWSMVTTDLTNGSTTTSYSSDDPEAPVGDNWFAVGLQGAGGGFKQFYIDNIVVTASGEPTITLNRPTVDERNTSFVVNYDVSDPTNDTLNCRLLVNTTGGFTVNVSNNSLSPPTTVEAVVEAADGFHSWLVECDDGTNFVNSTGRVFELDSTPPLSIAASIESASFDPAVNQTVTFEGTYEDSLGFMFNVSYTWTNGSGVVFAAHNDTTDNISQLKLSTTVNISSLAQGNYTVFWNGSDAHTKNKIKSYNPSVNVQSRKLTYFPPDSPDQQIVVRLLNSPFPITGVSDLKREDRHSFRFDPVIPAPDRGLMHTYEFEVESVYPILTFDESTGHLIIWQSRNWVTFDVEGVDDEQYSINLGTREGMYVAKVFVTTSADLLHFNSLGGLNTGSEVYTVELNTPLPPVPPDLPLARVITLAAMMFLLAGILSIVRRKIVP